MVENAPDSGRAVLFAGGGTAGHVFPSLAVGRALVAADPDLRPVFVGTAGRLEARLVPEAGFPLHHIDALPLPRQLSPAVFRLPGALRRAVARCSELMDETDAVAVVCFGGYVSFPLALAVRRRDVPLVIHEQNSLPGLANRVAARWADRVAVTFPGSAVRFPRRERVSVTGNPVREEILAVDRDGDLRAAKRRLGLDPDRVTLLVFGGSQGAQRLNQAVVDSCGRWKQPERIQVLHAAGQLLYEETAAAWQEAAADSTGLRVQCRDFIDDMAAAYAAADVVLCRAGATSVAELTAMGIASVLVPYPHATGNHQRLNAEALARVGAARMVLDADLDGSSLVGVVEPLLHDEEKRRRVASAAAAFGRRDAAANVVRLILDLVETREVVT